MTICLIGNEERAPSGDLFSWPNGAKAAVCLTYDDGLPSHIHTVGPMLKRYKFKATFYPTLAAPSIQEDMAKWRRLAKQGHELGNHSLYHPCRKSQADMDWVPDWYDMDKYSLAQMLGEISLANHFLQALDGKTSRTFAYPCGHHEVDGQDFKASLSAYATAARDASELQSEIPTIQRLDLYDIPSWAPNGHQGQDLINYIDQIIAKQSLSTFTFHGIGAEHMTVSIEAHEALLKYLDQHRKEIWVTTVKEATDYLRKKR